MSSDDDRIEEALARIAERRAVGEPPAVEAILAEHPDLEGPLRAHLRVVGLLDGLRDSRTSAASSGVLESLSHAGRTVRPVSLPDPLGEEPPSVVLSHRPPGRWGRYAVQGQIARGGVGVVLKARDPDLGRDVALKVLRDEYASNPDALQRFVEEAQVGGQLQHPGIVPVHELGMSSDGRPFFAMRLVRGKTFASLLAARESPTADRPRLISVFESVCQTIAYAHERRIVHRDLKPSNVMVGGFGEVQVLDWGMAKVLASGGADDDAHASEDEPRALVRTDRSGSGSAPSLEGSVLGTPQYMAPEQARGQTPDLDERADVFSLGAILCEILTGRPPYAAKEAEVLREAAAGNVGPAHERLRGSGADPQLVSLGIRCLAATRADRPRDAGVVARELTAYLASLEDRARTAIVEATEARVVAAGERRARRLTLTLATAATTFVLLGVGGWLWFDAGRRARAESAGREVAEALDETTRLRAKAEAADPDAALPIWREAVAAARRAQAVASAGEADSATRTRATTTASEVGDAWKRAEEVAGRRRRDVALVERLDRIRALAGRSRDWKRAAVAYAAAFREALGAELETLDVAEAARRVAASPIHVRLVRALDGWTQARERIADDANRLRDVLALVDADPWRARLRAGSRNVQELRTLANDVRLDSLDVDDVLLLGQSLGVAGDAERAVTLADAAWRRHAGDYWLCREAGYWCGQTIPPKSAEGVRYLSAALALEPLSPWAHADLGDALAVAGDYLGAIAEYREAIRLEPTLALAHDNLGGDVDGVSGSSRSESKRRSDENAIWFHMGFGRALGDQGRALGDRSASRNALLELREAVRIEPREWWAWIQIGKVLADLRQFDAAMLAYREAIQLEPRSVDARLSLGEVLRLSGDLDGAIAELRKTIGLGLGGGTALNHLGTALSEKGDFKGAVAAHREAIQLEPADATHRVCLGNCLSELGNLDEAIIECREAVRLDPVCAEGYTNLGKCLFLKGDPLGSIAASRAAIALDPTETAPHMNLGIALLDAGDEDAIVEFREALRLDPQFADAHEWLGEALAALGRVDQAVVAQREWVHRQPMAARAHLRLGVTLDLDGNRDAAAVEAREAARLDSRFAAAERLSAFAYGGATLTTSKEALELARVAYDDGLYAASSRAWIAVFAIEPSLADDVRAGPRYDAACAAALAAAGRGLDAIAIDLADRARLRRQAIDWLRADLDAWKKLDSAEDRGPELDHWRREFDLWGLRGGAQLAKAPTADREACRRLWADVDALVAASARPR